MYELKNNGNGKYVSKCKVFLLILNFFKTFRVVVLGWWEDKTLDHFPFQYLTKNTVNMEYLLDIIPLPHQILPSPCSYYLEADLYGSGQKAPLPSRFYLHIADGEYKRTLGVWRKQEETGWSMFP